MMRRGWVLVVMLALGCSKEPPEPKVEVTSVRAPASSAPQPSVSVPVASREVSDDLPERMAKLAFKPDPYGDRPSCVSEQTSSVRDELVLTVRLSLTRGADQTLTASDVQYHVSESRVRNVTETPVALGIPRLEFVRADGSLIARDFQGEYTEPGDATRRLSTSEVPRDPTWVKVWLASLPMAANVTAHRITLDGKLLVERKRPASPPSLSSIACDAQGAEGVKLAWRSTGPDASLPLLVDVMRRGPLGFVEELPLTDARKVDGITLSASQAAERDAILLVSVTDTFRLVSRGVLVPKRAL